MMGACLVRAVGDRINFGVAMSSVANYTESVLVPEKTLSFHLLNNKYVHRAALYEYLLKFAPHTLQSKIGTAPLEKVIVAVLVAGAISWEPIFKTLRHALKFLDCSHTLQQIHFT
jgi:hypothetical protein